MLKKLQHKNKKNEHYSKKYDDVLDDDAHNVLHPIMLLPKAEDLIVVHIYFYKVPLVSHPKGLFFMSKNYESKFLRFKASKLLRF